MEASKTLSLAIGMRVKFFRSKMGMSQDDFGSYVGADRTYINKIENGTCNLTIYKLCSVCEKIGITLHEFFNDQSFREKLFIKMEED